MMSAARTASRNTVMDLLHRWANECPDRVWLRDRKGEEFTEWSWRAARAEIEAIAAWLESESGASGLSCALLSRNRAHWILADMAIIAAGNVTVPVFTTVPANSAKYILDFAGVRVLFLGESDNWEQVRDVVSEDIKIVALPGVDPGRRHLQWDDIIQEFTGQEPGHRCRPDELMSIVFTSGTTGVPKGVMQTHDSMVIPTERSAKVFAMRGNPRFLSYLPLAHQGERQLVWINSLVNCGEVTFNESMPQLVRDMAACKPSFFFGAPRIWEQLQQHVIGMFNSQETLDQAMAQDPSVTRHKIRTALGLQDTDFVLSGGAPTPASLIRWFAHLGVDLKEGYGMTEAMGLIANTREESRIGSIGRPIEGVQARVADNQELLFKADGLSPGYYKMPEKTAETFVDGWVRTGDTARTDDDGFYFITGRLKDYFKTAHGKFVSAAPIENAFASNRWVEQLCLLGRGYSKTVLVCVLSEPGRQQDRATVESALKVQVERVNAETEKHARIGVVMVCSERWKIEDGTLTPTLKVKRNQVEDKYGKRAQALACEAAKRGCVLVEFVD